MRRQINGNLAVAGTGIFDLGEVINTADISLQRLVFEGGCKVLHHALDRLATAGKEQVGEGIDGDTREPVTVEARDLIRALVLAGMMLHVLHGRGEVKATDADGFDGIGRPKNTLPI